MLTSVLTQSSHLYTGGTSVTAGVPLPFADTEPAQSLGLAPLEDLWTSPEVPSNCAWEGILKCTEVTCECMSLHDSEHLPEASEMQLQHDQKALQLHQGSW